ncbi:MAG: hypothetical protein QNJ60_20195 [Xenococcaceae cyanobacterium MO_188.B19]|nr:hypothetical protein [Xenococcaceae cyanobacterium MO_188.B19]
MNHLDKDLAVAQTVVLMTSYSFDLQGYTLDQLLSKWLTNYHSSWIRLATIEALYLGRYKAISIEQVMAVWSRLGSPKVHFGGEFERLICRKLPRHLVPDRDSEKLPKPKIESDTSHLTSKPKQQADTRPELSEVLNSDNSNQDLYSTSQNHSSSHQAQAESSPVSISDPAADTKPIPSASHFEKSQTQSSTSIEGFTPIPDMSSLFQKLKAIANTD